MSSQSVWNHEKSKSRLFNSHKSLKSAGFTDNLDFLNFTAVVWNLLGHEIIKIVWRPSDFHDRWSLKSEGW